MAFSLHTPGSPRMAALAAILLSGSAWPALALDGDAFAAKINEGLGVGGGRIDYSAAEADGDTVRLTDAKAVNPGQEPIALGTITFEGVEETGDGGYTVETLRIPDIEQTLEDGALVTARNIEATGLNIPADPTMESLDTMLFYEGFSFGPLTVSIEGREVFSMASMKAEVEKSGDEAVNMTAVGNGLKADMTVIEDPKAREALDALGYDTLSGTFRMDLGWNAESGEVNVRDYSLTFDDVGQLSVAFALTGYTREMIKGLQEAQKAMAANPDPAQGQQAYGLAMMGLMQQLNFKGATIRFEDASLTERLLAYSGQQQGISGDQMAQAVKGMLPLMLAQMNMPALQAQITEAAGTFLDDPESLTISAEPAEPVPFPQIMGAGMSGNPQQVVDLLAVEVTAND